MVPVAWVLQEGNLPQGHDSFVHFPIEKKPHPHINKCPPSPFKGPQSTHKERFSTPLWRRSPIPSSSYRALFTMQTGTPNLYTHDNPISLEKSPNPHSKKGLLPTRGTPITTLRLPNLCTQDSHPHPEKGAQIHGDSPPVSRDGPPTPYRGLPTQHIYGTSMPPNSGNPSLHRGGAPSPNPIKAGAPSSHSEGRTHLHTGPREA